MTEMISQCPKCMTSFRVTEDQLTVAGGKVRCGYCMNVFMGQDYLISGGEQGMGMADEDVLRSLLDGDDGTMAAESSDPPLAHGIETHQHYDIDSLLSEGPEQGSSSVSLDHVSLRDEPPVAEAATQGSVLVGDDFGLSAGSFSNVEVGTGLAESGLGIEEELSAAAVDDIFAETTETEETLATPEPGSEGFLPKAEGSLSKAEGFLPKAEGSIPKAEGSTLGKESADLIEPDISLIEENLKFDEDDLRDSTDEDWALELLAELEGTGKYKDSTDASDAYVKELLADTESTLHDADDVFSSDTGPSERQNHRSGLGFEEIIVDAVPPSDEDSEGNSGQESEAILDAAADTDVIVQSQASGDNSADASKSVFTAEFSSANAAPALGQAGLVGAENAVVPETESEAPGEHEQGGPEELAESDLFEDPSSVYQQSSEPLAEPEPSITAQSIDELINEGVDEPKRRKTDFLPQDIDISQSPAGATTAGNFIEWKWIAGSLGMVLLMLVQYSYFYWGDLTASAKTRPMFVSVCNVLGCELPPYRSLRSVKTDQLSVRSHPDSDAALIVDIILTNKAELAQPFPVLQLTFFDIRSQPVATRKFFPNEYLDGELRGLSSMPSENPIRLALEIMDPGADAINYELNLLPTL